MIMEIIVKIIESHFKRRKPFNYEKTVLIMENCLIM
jgi:hypothetical protein